MSTTGWTTQDAAELAEMEAVFEHAGGRGVDLAERIDALRAKRDKAERISMLRTRTSEIFLLDEQAASDYADDDDGLGTFAERYPVENDHDAALAIDTAIYPSDGLGEVIITTDGWHLSVSLEANPDGDLDGYRILVRPPGWPHSLAGEYESIPAPYQPDGSITYPDTLDVLRDAAAEANRLAAFALTMHPAASQKR